jgi:hypothetical protein
MRRAFSALLAAAGVCCALVAGAAGAVAGTVNPTPPSGQWTAAEPVPGLAPLNVGKVAELNDIACASGGNCAAGGSFTAANGVVQAWIASEVNGSWHAAEEVPGTATMNWGGYAAVEYVSCPAPGECVAVGQVASEIGGHMTTFAATEAAGGGWAAANSLGAADAMFVAAISCPQAGQCVLGGQTGAYPSIRTERGVSWGAPLILPGITTLSKRSDATLDALTCPTPGNCVAGGSYYSRVGNALGQPYQEAFVASEVNGRWDPAVEVPAIARLNAGGLAQILTISCVSAGDCAAAGSYQNGAGDTVTFVANEVAGTWGAALPVPGSGGEGDAGGSWVTGLSCTAAATCVAAGQVGLDGFIAQEIGGTWGRIRLVPDLTGHGTSVDEVSCRSAGNCVATGSAQLGTAAADVGAESFAMTERSGAWSRPTPLSVGGGATESDALACGPDGDCSVGGWIQYGADDQSASYSAYVAGYTPPPWVDETTALNAGAVQRLGRRLRPGGRMR